MNINSTLLLILSTISGSVSAWNILTDDFDVRCQQTAQILNCSYRSLATPVVGSPVVGSPVVGSEVSPKTTDDAIQISNITPFPQAGDTTAILFMVDTSDPGRQNVIEKNRVHLKTLLADTRLHHKIGLASFDKDIRFISPIGTSNYLLLESVNSLDAIGKTTELFRNLIKAIDHLKSFAAKRKFIILFSDGQAEDKAYFHSDVVKAARKHGVVINAIGYPRSIPLSVALQTIRRISEETGGHYIETDMRYDLTPTALKSLLANMDNGGSFSIDLTPLAKSSRVPDSVTLGFNAQNIEVPVRIKAAKRQPERTIGEFKPADQITANNNPPIQIITKQDDDLPINLWLWYGLPVAFIIIIIFILITLFLLWNRRSEAGKNTDSGYKPYAYLISADGSETRYPITRTIWRIGRSSGNELTLNDASLSRHHAEIHRNADGSFNIIDMNSMNGIYVNDKKIKKAALQEGDLVEIGDIFLRFSKVASDYVLEESTVMQKTRQPGIQ